MIISIFSSFRGTSLYIQREGWRCQATDHKTRTHSTHMPQKVAVLHLYVQSPIPHTHTPSGKRKFQRTYWPRSTHAVIRLEREKVSNLSMCAWLRRVMDSCLLPPKKTRCCSVSIFFSPVLPMIQSPSPSRLRSRLIFGEEGTVRMLGGLTGRGGLAGLRIK